VALVTLPRADHVRNAHYHAIAATAKWAALKAAEQAARTKSAAIDERTDAQRRRATTYAKGEAGYS
jgi:type IV secretory pathway VirD2 relaxase